LKAELVKVEDRPVPMAVIKVLEFRINKKCQVVLLGAIECEIAEELKAAKKR
jgi:hypothetical protein